MGLKRAYKHIREYGFRDYVLESIARSLSKRNIILVKYETEERAKVLSLIRAVKRETRLALRYVEAHALYMAAKNTQKLKGDIAEVGVYKGGTAKIMCEAQGSRSVHLFDTFEGLPPVAAIDNYTKGEYSASKNHAENLLRNYPRIHFYVGVFPKTAAPVKNKKFSLVHLDVDIYQSTKDSLEFFYPRMVKGGIIISHDYSNAHGVRKAFDEFFKNKPEPIIELPGSQCLVVKA